MKPKARKCCFCGAVIERDEEGMPVGGFFANGTMGLPGVTVKFNLAVCDDHQKAFADYLKRVDAALKPVLPL